MKMQSEGEERLFFLSRASPLADTKMFFENASQESKKSLSLFKKIFAEKLGTMEVQLQRIQKELCKAILNSVKSINKTAILEYQSKV